MLKALKIALIWENNKVKNNLKVSYQKNLMENSANQYSLKSLRKKK